MNCKLNSRTAPIVALDIGRVCVHLTPHRCAQRLGFDAMSELLLAAPHLADVSRQAENGQISDDRFFAQLATASLLPVADGEMVEAWCDLIGQEMEGMADCVELMLAAGLRPVFFSNISWTHFDHIRGFLSFSDRITDAVLSCAVGASKPETPMYEFLEREYCGALPPTLYVDDLPENIETGMKRGWRCHQFKHIGDFREELAQVIADAHFLPSDNQKRLLQNSPAEER